MNTYVKFIFCVLLLTNIGKTYSQFFPPVSQYTPKTYNADNQNWSIDQGDNGHIYVANNKGLLTYNGEDWHTYKTPNESIMRSVLVEGEKIYTGCFRDFGYWQEDHTGVLNYTSLTKKLNINLDEDEQFWKIIKTENSILFQSLHNIYSIDISTNEVRKISPENGVYKLFKIGNQLLISQSKHGISQIKSGKVNLVSDAPVFKDNSVINIYKMNDELYVQTDQAGIRSLENGEELWPDNGGSKNLNVYSSLFSPNKIILGTVSNGIVILNKKNGQQIQEFNTTNTLSNNTVLSLKEDQNGNIWAGLDNGINQINYRSAIRTYNDETGKLGTVYTSRKYNGSLYLGTNQGLFYQDLDKKKDEFKLVNGTKGQVWSLFVYDKKLFCGHDKGTYLVNKNRSEQISTIKGTWCFKKIPNRDNLILQGNYDGISILGKSNQNWILRNKVQGFNLSTKFAEFISYNKLIIDHEYKGVFTVEIDNKFTEAINIKAHNEVEKGLYSSLVRLDNDLVYANKNGLFTYSGKKKRFKKDSVLTNKAYGNSKYSSGKLVPTSKNSFWSFTSSSIRYVEESNLNKGYSVTTIPVSSNKRNAMVGYENVSQLQGEDYIFGTSSGLWIIDIPKLRKQTRTFKIQLDRIIAKNSKNARERRLSIIEKEDIEIAYKMNSLSFHVNIVDYRPYMEASYKYKIEGFNDKWSEWKKDNIIDIENLPFGKYTLKVSGKIGKQVSSNGIKYSFTVNRPFLLSNLMIVIYVIALVIVLFVYNRLQKNYFKKQKKALQDKNKRMLELKELKLQKEIMEVKNEQLENDVESKNRELAISTMSLIKKNEFLNKLKQEIKETEPPKNAIQRALHLIDRNINNNDDWKFFEEAFNNADKDFLKKVKAKHPSLTSNDLKLCAYLRLNLSSKDIAPLFNISIKSVEVKRYRLRKKMDLEHDESLTDYILKL